jgi:hypothetical protein
MGLLLSFGKEAVGEVLRCIPLVVNDGFGLLGPIVVVVREREDHALRRDALVVEALLAVALDPMLRLAYRVKKLGPDVVIQERLPRRVEPDGEPRDRVGLLPLQLAADEVAALRRRVPAALPANKRLLEANLLLGQIRDLKDHRPVVLEDPGVLLAVHLLEVGFDPLFKHLGVLELERPAGGFPADHASMLALRRGEWQTNKKRNGKPDFP